MAKNRPSKGGGGTRNVRPTSAQQRQSAQRAAAARQRIAAGQRRRRLYTVIGAVVAVVAIVAVLVIVKVVGGSGEPKSGDKAKAAPTSVLGAVASVPTATFDAVGTGTARTPPMALQGAPPLTTDGKPGVLYVGAEYCPFCAAERWGVAVALSRFGKLSHVGQTTSSPSDQFPSTRTLTFHGATYSSSLLSFAGKETQSNQVRNGQYTKLDKLSGAQTALFEKYDAPPYVPKEAMGSIPFVYIDGKYMISGASYDPGVLQGKSHAQIAKALADPNSAIAKAVDGTANYVTAAICAGTNDKPAAVCQSSGVTKAAAALDTSK